MYNKQKEAWIHWLYGQFMEFIYWGGHQILSTCPNTEKNLVKIKSVNREDLKTDLLVLSSPPPLQEDIRSLAPATLNVSVLFVLMLWQKGDKNIRLCVTPETAVTLTWFVLEQF